MEIGKTDNALAKKNIFICYTPLHVLISEKIIQLEKIDCYIIIFYYEKDNAKNKYYYEKLAKCAKRAFYIRKDNNAITAIKTFIFLYFKLKGSRYNFYTGNIKSLYARVLFFVLGWNNLYSFDDGLGNVGGDGYFYKNIERTKFSKFLDFFKLDFSYGKIYQSIRKHYTIYRLPNVMPYTEYISLFDHTNHKKLSSNVEDDAVILLTGTFYEEGIYKLDLEKELYKKILKKYNVTHVISHPLQKFNKVDDLNVEIIQSEKVAEEIILGMRQFNKITVIGIYSSVLMHLVGLERIELINIHCDVSAPTDSIKHLLASFNIETYYL